MRLKNESVRLIGLYSDSAGERHDGDVGEARWACWTTPSSTSDTEVLTPDRCDRGNNPWSEVLATGRASKSSKLAR